MHSLVRLYIKTAIVFLLVGLALGGWMIVEREVLQRAPNPFETSAHTHALFVGFVMMMILGVALWIFPRPTKSDAVYRPGLVRAAWWLVTAGTTLRIVSELLRVHSAAPLLRGAVVAGGLAQAAGIALFFGTMWSRIRPAGSQAREAGGERF